jgi:CheY-like chemotaxis protein
MITSRIAEKHREHARELGVNHYLGKPYSEEELLSLVKHYSVAGGQAVRLIGPRPALRRAPLYFCTARFLHHRIAPQRLFTRGFVVHHGQRVVAPSTTPAASSSTGGPSTARAAIGRQALELRQVAQDELALGVELAALRHRVEDAEPGLRVAAGRTGPLPAAVVGRQVVVVQLAGEVALAPAPVQPRSLLRKLAVTMRSRLCIQPVWLSWCIAASTSG